MVNSIQNDIPLLAIVIEFLVALSISTIAYLLWRKYQQRGDKPIKYLLFGVGSMSMAAYVSCFGKFLQFALPFGLKYRNYSGFTIVTAYCFTILANTFVILFYSAIFDDEGSMYPKKLLFLNGISFGFIFPNISFSEDVYNQILFFLIYHIIISMTVYGNLYRSSKTEEQNADDPIARTGFKFIGLFGVAVIALYVSFVVDLVVGIALDSSYTPFYYIGWISGGFASLFGYLGYIMPSWLRDRVSVEN